MRVILFDGVCSLCNRGVDFVLRRDSAARFRFAALQSEAGRRVLSSAGWRAPIPDALVLVEAGRVYTASTAVLRIAKGLGLPWALFYAFIWLPRPLRDGVYFWVARHRYRWFGRRSVCRMPSAEEQARFLEPPMKGMQEM